MSSRRTRAFRSKVGGAALVAALLVGTAACGSDGGEVADVDATVSSTAVATDPTAVFDRVSAASAQHDSVEARTVSEVAGQSMTMTMAMRLKPELAFTAEADAAGSTIQMVLLDRTIYLTGPEFGGQWVKASIDEKSGPFAGMGALVDSASQASDPTAQLSALKTVDGIEVVGTEEVDGVQTTHYRATVDASEALKTVPESLREQYEQVVAAGLDDYTIDVWVGTDHLPRRQVVTMTVAGQETATTIEYTNWGGDVSVVAPDNAVDFDQLAGAAG